MLYKNATPKLREPAVELNRIRGKEHTLLQSKFIILYFDNKIRFSLNQLN